MLIKDPYLASNHKGVQNMSHMANHVQFNQSMGHKGGQQQRGRAVSVGDVDYLQARVRGYQNELRSMEHAYNRQGEAARKLLNFNQVNHEYHEAMKMRNYELNTKLNDAVNELQLNHNRYTSDQHRNFHEKDQLLNKYQQQTDELLRLRANYHALTQQNHRLQEQVSHLTFLVEKEAHRHQLQIKEHLIRTQNMDQTYRDTLAAKDQEMIQLMSRLKLYQDENRKLTDMNRTLLLTKDKLENISAIESNIKAPPSHIKAPPSPSNHEQKTINEEMRRQLQRLRNQIGNMRLQQPQQSKPEPKNQTDILQRSKWQGLVGSVGSLRQGIAKQLFDVFVKSVGQGQRKKSNSLVIFIENWRSLDKQRLQPYVQSYLQARQSLKQIAAKSEVKQSEHYPKIRQIIPLGVGSQANRNSVNQWILSTVQFTKNQRESSKASLNNWLLFLFRLLTIQYRVKFPMQGKTYSLDPDVTNQLQHELIKGLQGVLNYQ